MPIERHILRDLLSGQSTADSIAGRLNLNTEAAETILKRLARQGLINHRPLPPLTVWFLNPDTRRELTA
ncbi:MAG: hypothetical protein U1E02_26625 [Hydrogenophaga sp.]|nr:hypothetical protein [Luteolibacter sp.]MDZ4127713.1 hypothetical protein [Hydrogenophaga sp.]